VYLSVFTLYGLWAETGGWANNLQVVAYQNWYIFIPVLLVCLMGAVYLYKKEKNISIFLLTILFFSSVFSVGVGGSIFKNINQFIFDHVWFWKGFRDSQKWTGVVATILSILISLGMESVFEKVKKIYIQIIVYIFITSCIVIYSYKIFFGFSDQLKPIFYPAEWEQANEILKQDKDCTAVFLPWEMYYELSFNNSVLTGNPASKYFDCRIFTSLDPEFGIGDSFTADQERIRVNEIMKSSNKAAIPGELHDMGVKYLIVSVDEFRNPRYREMFSGKVIPIFVSNQIVLIKVDDILKLSN
jgi:hypothetical protein